MNGNLNSCPITLNTTRICCNDTVNMAVDISRIGFASMRPNAVILVNKNEIFDGITASALVHFPINAPLLFTDGRKLNRETLAEINRLGPKGHNGIHVILVGNISKNVALELNYYGLKTHHITGSNHYETACRIFDERKEFKNILIISGQDYSEGIMTPYWSAHHGDPILFVQRDNIPRCTLESIRKFHYINVYIVGSPRTVSKSVDEFIAKLPNVKYLDRIQGESPYDISVNFSKYRDDKTEFGWGKNYRDGHAFTFGTLKHPMEAVAGALFAHMGKHTPMLLTKEQMIPSEIKDYINSIKPMPPNGMPKPPFMHGYIIGDISNISNDTQISIEEALSIDHEM